MNCSSTLPKDPDQFVAEIVRLSKERGIDPAALHKITNCSSIREHLAEIHVNGTACRRKKLLARKRTKWGGDR